MSCMGSLSGCTMIVLDFVVSMCIHVCNFIYYICYMQLMRARNEIKVNESCNCQFLYQQWFCNPNCDWYNIRYQ